MDIIIIIVNKLMIISTSSSITKTVINKYCYFFKNASILNFP